MIGPIAAARRRSSGGGGGTDPYWSSVVYLNGFNSASTYATDESSYAHAGTENDTGNQLSAVTTSPKFGSHCLRRDGDSGGGGMISYADHASLEFGSNSFTVEGWIKLGAAPTGYNVICAKWDVGPQTGSFAFYIWDNKLGVALGHDATYVYSDSGSALTWATGVWYYVCLDYNGSKYRVYRAAEGDTNTTMVHSLTASYTLSDTSHRFSVGDDYFNGNPAGRALNCYLDELRVTNGVARYANDSGFAVPTSAFPRS